MPKFDSAMPHLHDAIREVNEHRISFENAAAGYPALLKMDRDLFDEDKEITPAEEIANELANIGEVYAQYGREIFESEEVFEEVGLTIAGLARMMHKALNPEASPKLYEDA